MFVIATIETNSTKIIFVFVCPLHVLKKFTCTILCDPFLWPVPRLIIFNFPSLSLASFISNYISYFVSRKFLCGQDPFQYPVVQVWINLKIQELSDFTITHCFQLGRSLKKKNPLRFNLPRISWTMNDSQRNATTLFEVHNKNQACL